VTPKKEASNGTRNSHNGYSDACASGTQGEGGKVCVYGTGGFGVSVLVQVFLPTSERERIE
jgi:hypothetical protein